jgi:uncharacterized protein YbaP (TraB family)
VENPEFDPDAMADIPPPAPVDPDYSVLQELGIHDSNRARALLAAAGAMEEALRGQDAGAAYQTLAVLVDQQVGVDYTAIPEAVFKQRAREAGIPIRSEWGDIRSILAFAAAMPHEVKLDLVRSKLNEADRIPSFEDDLNAWLRGDVSRWATMNAAEQATWPAAYRTINTGRNADWAETVETLLERPGQRFVCVGVRHLAGPGSIIELLETAGVSVRRL